jgi:hypothetical protein
MRVVWAAVDTASSVWVTVQPVCVLAPGSHPALTSTPTSSVMGQSAGLCCSETKVLALFLVSYREFVRFTRVRHAEAKSVMLFYLYREKA